MTASPEFSSEIYDELDHIVDTQNVSYHDAWDSLHYKHSTEEHGIDIPTYDPSETYANVSEPATTDQLDDSTEPMIYGPFGETATEILDSVAAAKYASQLRKRGGAIVILQTKGDITPHESQAIFAAMRNRTADLTISTHTEEPPEDM